MRVAVIPARGGSVRVPRKNVRAFDGKPMLLYPIANAMLSGLFDLIAVSTDDAEIAAVALAAGAVVVPRDRDDGTTGTQEIAARVLDKLDAQGVACVIYPTTPLLLPEDLQKAHRQMVMNSTPFVYSVGPDGVDAGAFYWGSCHAFRDRIGLDHGQTYEMPAERVCDINTPEDFSRAESLYQALRRAA